MLLRDVPSDMISKHLPPNKRPADSRRLMHRIPIGCLIVTVHQENYPQKRRPRVPTESVACTVWDPIIAGYDDRPGKSGLDLRVKGHRAVQ